MTHTDGAAFGFDTMADEVLEGIDLAGKLVLITGGAFLADCGICPVDNEAQMQTVVRSYAAEPEAAERLRARSEDMVGTRFAS